MVGVVPGEHDSSAPHNLPALSPRHQKIIWLGVVPCVCALSPALPPPLPPGPSPPQFASTASADAEVPHCACKSFGIHCCGDLGLLFVPRFVQIGIQISQHHQYRILGRLLHKSLNGSEGGCSVGARLRRRKVASDNIVPDLRDLELKRDDVWSPHLSILQRV